MGLIDYESPIGTNSYTGRGFYSYQSDTLQGGRYLFAVKAEGGEGVQDGSMARWAIWLITANPEGIDILDAKTD